MRITSSHPSRPRHICNAYSNRSSSVPPTTLEVDLEKTQNSVGQGVEHVSGVNKASEVVASGVNAATGNKNVPQGAEQEDHNYTPVFNTPSAEDGLSQQVVKDSAREQKLALELQNKEQHNSIGANDVEQEDVEMTDAFQQEPAAAAAVHPGDEAAAAAAKTDQKSATDLHDAENDKKKHDTKHVFRFASPVEEERARRHESAQLPLTTLVWNAKCQIQSAILWHHLHHSFWTTPVTELHAGHELVMHSIHLHWCWYCCPCIYK